MTHAYNSQTADSNVRALSARGLMKTTEVESTANLSVAGLETEVKKKQNERRSSYLDRTV